MPSNPPKNPPRPLGGFAKRAPNRPRDASEPTVTLVLPAAMEDDEIEYEEATNREGEDPTDPSDDEASEDGPTLQAPSARTLPRTNADAVSTTADTVEMPAKTSLRAIASLEGPTSTPRSPNVPERGPDASETPRSRPMLSLLDSLRVRPKAAPRKSVEVRRVEVRKPRPTEWFRAMTPPHFADFRLIAVELNGSRHVLPEPVARLVPAPTFVVRVVLCVAEHGALFVWLPRATDADGVRAHQAHVAAEEAAMIAEHAWTRLWWSHERSEYVIETPEEAFDEPSLDGMNLDDVIEKAIASVLIDSTDHPKIRALRGVR